MIEHLNISALTIALATVTMSGVALAGSTAPAPVLVSATVATACSLDVGTGVNFGTYTLGSESDAIGTFGVQCSGASTVNLAVTMSAGNNANHAQGTDTRAMATTSGTSFLSYDLFQDAGHTTVWSPTQPATFTLTFTQNTLPPSFSIYGRIRSTLTGLVNGSYSDLVTINATF